MLALWLAAASHALALQCPPGTHLQQSVEPPQTWCATADGTKSGPFESRHANGKIRTQATYKNGLADGNYIRYSDEGRMLERGVHRAGKMHGRWEHFDDEGALKDQTLWRDGVPNGPFDFYFPNGKKKASGAYLNGELSGKWAEWDSEGRLSQSGEYRCGNRVGTWTLVENNQSRTSTYPSNGCGGGVEWTLLRGEAIVALDRGTLALATFAGSWVPRFPLTSWFALRPRLGLSVVKIETGSTLAPIAIGDLWAEFRPFRRWTVGLGAGAQYVFTSQGGIVPVGSAFISYEPGWNSLRWLKAITLGETCVFAQPNSFLLFTLGADIAL